MPRTRELSSIHAGFIARSRLAIAAFLACSALLLTLPAADAADFRISFEMNERMRSAVISEPRRLKHVPRATIIVLHGTENGARIRRRLGLDATVASAGYATVYPDAIGGHWHNGLETPLGPNDDVLFLKSLISRLVASGITDPRRVYIVGASAGGMMALRFACESGESIAGTVAFLANLPATLAECKPPKALPFLLVNGTADPIVPYGGGAVALKNRKGDVLSTEATLGVFAKTANCTGDRTAKQFEDKDKEDNTTAFRETYAHCNLPVELIRIEGGGHTLPGKGKGIGPSENVGAFNRDIESTKLIWEFIRRLPRS
eukprot:gene2343-2380_t